MKVPISQIEPLRPKDKNRVYEYTYLALQQRAPAISLIRQDGKYRYRIFDGAHRFAAAKRAGRRTIDARVIAS